MANVQVQVDVSKEMNEMMDAIVGVVEAMKQALADGFQPGQDLPAIVLAAVNLLPPALQGMDLIGDELKQNPKEFANAAALGAAKLLGKFI